MTEWNKYFSTGMPHEAVTDLLVALDARDMPDADVMEPEAVLAALTARGWIRDVDRPRTMAGVGGAGPWCPVPVVCELQRQRPLRPGRRFRVLAGLAGSGAPPHAAEERGGAAYRDPSQLIPAVPAAPAPLAVSGPRSKGIRTPGRSRSSHGSDVGPPGGVQAEVAGHRAGVRGHRDARAGRWQVTLVKIVGHRATSRFVRTSKALTRALCPGGVGAYLAKDAPVLEVGKAVLDGCPDGRQCRVGQLLASCQGPVPGGLVIAGVTPRNRTRSATQQP